MAGQVPGLDAGRHRRLGPHAARPHAARAASASSEELIASARLDNLCSCLGGRHGAGRAGSDEPATTSASCALFDHEEVGSESTTGAAGPLLETVLDRLVLARGGTAEDRHRAFAASSCVSADMAHAVHPNYPERHEPGHRPLPNARPGAQGQRQPALRHRRRDRGALHAGLPARPACRGRCSSPATRCPAGPPSGRSPPPASASPPSTSAARSCRCTRPGSCAAPTTRRSSSAALGAYFGRRLTAPASGPRREPTLGLHGARLRRVEEALQLVVQRGRDLGQGGPRHAAPVGARARRSAARRRGGPCGGR